MNSDAVATAIKGLIATATKAPCLEHDEAQATHPSPPRYSIIYLSRRFGGNIRGGTQENDLRRLQVRVSAKSVADVRLIEDRIADLFAHSTHDVAGTLMHFAFETSDAAPERDNEGFYSRLTDYTTTV